MMNEFDWLYLRIPYGQPIKFIEDSLCKPMRSLVLVNSLRVINTSVLHVREITFAVQWGPAVCGLIH